jgi:hypothetical protein
MTTPQSEERLTDAAIQNRKDNEAIRSIGYSYDPTPAAPHPDDLFIHFSASEVNELPPHVWMQFKAEVYAYVARKLKELGT